MTDRAQLPPVVNAIGERIGLNYNINRKKATRDQVEKVQSRIGFEQFVNQNYKLKDEQRCKGKAKLPKKQRSKIKLNAKQRKNLYNLTHAEKQKLRYSTFERVNSLWLQYFDRIKVDSLDLYRVVLHGCKITCIESKNPTLVGAEGLVVKETKHTFLIIKTTNATLTIPKKESKFQFCDSSGRTFVIDGQNLLSTTNMRSKNKPKMPALS